MVWVNISTPLFYIYVIIYPRLIQMLIVKETPGNYSCARIRVNTLKTETKCNILLTMISIVFAIEVLKGICKLRFYVHNFTGLYTYRKQSTS